MVMGFDCNEFDSPLRSGVSEALDAAGIDVCTVATHVLPPAVAPVELDARLVADALGLDPQLVPQMLADRRIATLCERGTGADEGLFRFTFYHAGQRFRLVTDRAGEPSGR